ncbi:MAG: T9SS type A sorting domain-containing protein [Flavobacteriales bacterium]|jgi:hypothetical protein|nr:T9SS type A sorting domain-containing protein [Flavobacteriales bacterium]
MKQIVLIMLINLIGVVVYSQVSNNVEPRGWRVLKSEGIPTYQLPSIDLEALKAEDVVNDQLPMPWRFGYKHEVDYRLSDGSWEELENGDQVWRVKFESKGALSLNVEFDRFYIPEGAALSIYDEDYQHVLGEYTAKQNQESRRFGTWLLEADNMIIEYYQPHTVSEEVELHIGAITHGYRNAASFKAQKNLNSSGNCNLDVDCSIGNDWAAHKDLNKKSVGLLLSGGSSFCSGALVNNTANDGKPYFLTANHCYSDPSLWSFRFEWISPNPVCATTTQSSNGPTTKTISGATLRAKSANTDFCLVEINSPIPTSWDLTWAGWDKTDNFPTYVVGIHHPAGDIMKVCRDDTGPIKAANAGAQTWEITSAGDGWEMGVTEGGSSGSPLFDQDGRVIGQLYGGGAACSGVVDNDLHDYYGRFGVSWDGASASERLKDWLDPSNSNVSILDAYPPLQVYALDAGVSVLFPEEECAQTSLTPSIKLRNAGTTTLTSATIVWTFNGGASSTINWAGSLAQGQTEDISLGSLSSGNNDYTIVATVSSPNGGIDENSNNDTVSSTYTLSANSFGTTKVYLDVLTDNYSNETTWEFRNANGTVIQTGGPYTNDNAHYLDTFNVSVNECYEFEIFDSEADGICCFFGSGSYELKTDNNTIISQGGEFGANELTEFTVSSTSAINEEKGKGIIIYPNPVDEQLNLVSDEVGVHTYTIYNAVGQIVVAGSFVSAVQIDVANYPSGVYFIKSSSERGAVITSKIIKE